MVIYADGSAMAHPGGGVLVGCIYAFRLDGKLVVGTQTVHRKRARQYLFDRYGSTEAEVAAVTLGLKALSQENGYEGRVRVRTDCKVLADSWVREKARRQEGRTDSPLQATIRKDVSSQAHLFEDLVVEWIPREENASADRHLRHMMLVELGSRAADTPCDCEYCEEERMRSIADGRVGAVAGGQRVVLP